MGASTMLSRVNTLVNVGYGEELDNDPRNTIEEDYINEEDRNLNRKGRKYLSNLYEYNEEFRDEIKNCIRDKKKIEFEVILDRRYKTNMFNMTGKKFLAEYITSKDNTKDLIEIMSKYYPRSSSTDGQSPMIR